MVSDFRCRCGHELERHLENEACDVEDCTCLGFEVAWSEDEEVVRV